MKAFLVSLLFSLLALGQQIPITTAQQLELHNIVPNAGYENGKASWVNSGGTFTVQTGTIITGAQSAAFTASTGSQYIQSAAIVIPRTLYSQDCMASIKYVGGSSSLYLTVVDGSDAQIVALTDSKLLNVDAGTKIAKLYFTCPASGSIKLRVVSSASSAIAYVDDTFIGLSDNEYNKTDSENFIKYSDAENGTGGWATYADAAGTRPVDGTAGSPNVLWTLSQSTPIQGGNSFLFTKDAANRQGQGASYAFSIPAYARGKALSVTVPYQIQTGTFTAGTSTSDSDIIVYFYDVTNSKLVEASSLKLLSNSSSLVDYFKAQVQFDSNCTSARIIFHVATTSASAYSLKFDSVSVAPSNYSYGTPVSDWQSYTPTFGAGIGTATSVNFKWRKVGDSIEITGSFVTGTVTASTASFTIPSGLTVDTTNKVTVGVFPGDWLRMNATATTRKRGKIALAAANTNILEFRSDDYTAAVSPISTQAGNGLFANSEAVSVQVTTLPINGFASSVQMSDQADTRIVGFRARRSTAATAITGTTGVTYDAVYNLVDSDSHGAYNSSTGIFTVPVAGYYKCNAAIIWAANATTTGFRAVMLNKNGSVVSQKRIKPIDASNLVTAQTDDLLLLNNGDTIKVQVNQNSGVTIGLEQTDANVNIENVFTCTRQSAQSQIAANELISVKYFNNAGTSIPNNTSTIIDFGTKDHDTHGAVTTGASWKFTAPIAGTYRVDATVLLNANTGWGTNEALELDLYKNGVFNTLLDYNNCINSGGANVNVASTGTTIMKLNAGDYIHVQFTQASGGAITLAAAGYNHISITRIGF